MELKQKVNTDAVEFKIIDDVINSIKSNNLLLLDSESIGDNKQVISPSPSVIGR